jgi:hypothetical protein
VFAVSTFALGFVAAKTRRGVNAAAALGILGIGLAPVVAGTSARVTLITAVATVCVALLAVAALDRSSPRLSVGVLPTVLFAVVPAAGWAAVTRDASITVLLVVAGAAALTAMVATSDVVRVASGVSAGALTIALAGVWTAAFDVGPARPVSPSSALQASSSCSARTYGHQLPTVTRSSSPARLRAVWGSSSRRHRRLGLPARSPPSSR